MKDPKAVVAKLCEIEEILVDTKDKDERTPLISAAMKGNLEIVKFLV